MTQEYKIIDGTNSDAMSDTINLLLQQGWKLYGNLSVIRIDDFPYFTQTLVREIEQRNAWS